MKTLSSREVQKNFGSVGDLVTSGESVRVTRYGRPAFLIIPENAETENLMRIIAGRRLLHTLKTTKPTDQSLTLSQEEVNQLIHECLA